MVYFRRNLLVLSFVSFLSNYSWFQLMPFLPLYIKEFGVTDGVPFWAGVMIAASTLGAIVMSPYWGKLADKYGSKLMVIRAKICVILILLGMSYCQNLWQLLLLWLLQGMLSGVITASITLIAKNTPKTQAPRYVAIIQSIATFAAIVGPMGGSIMINWVGYRGLIFVSSIMMIVGVIIVSLLVKERQEATIYVKSTSLWQDYHLAIKKPVLVTTLYSDMSYGFLTMAGQPLLILYIQELVGHRAIFFTGPIFSLPGIAIVLTNYWWCRLGEQYTFQRIVLIGLAGVGLFTLMQGLIRDIWWFAITYFLAGLFAAAVSPNTAGLITTQVEIDFQGRAFALQQSSRCFGYLLAPLLAGYLGAIISLQLVFIIVGLLGFASVVMIWLQMGACYCKGNDTGT